MISTRTLALAGLLLSAFAVPATAVTAPCDGCGYSQMQSKALTIGKGEHIIYSFSTGDIRGFSVTCQGNVPLGGMAPDSSSSTGHDRNGAPGADNTYAAGSCPFGRSLVIDDAMLSGNQLDAWILALDFYQKNGGRTGRVDLRYDTGDLPHGRYSESVYSILSDYQARTDLFDALLDNPTIGSYAAAFVAGVIAAVGFLPNQLLVAITFEDGSSVVLRYDGALRTLEVVPNSARLTNGQAAVENNSREYQGNYGIGGIDLGMYVGYLGSIGVNVTNGGTAGRLVCTWDGHVLTCKLPYMPN